MRETEILNCLRENLDSYIERDCGSYCIKASDGRLLSNYCPTDAQIQALEEAEHIKAAPRKRYILAGR